MMTHEEYKEMIKKAASQFKTGKPIFGKDGAFHQVLEDFLNAALEAEMDVHLEKTKPENRENRRNGKMPKEIKTAYGAVQINTPRDREGSFNRNVKPCLPKVLQTELSAFTDSDKVCAIFKNIWKMILANTFQPIPLATSQNACGQRLTNGERDV